MIDLTDLGLEPVDSAATIKPAETVKAGTGLEPGSVLARALYETWIGTPVTIVDSPPGSGKTTLLADVTATLLDRTTLAVVVATPTRNGAIEVARRIAATIDERTGDSPGRPRVVLGLQGIEPPTGVLKPIQASEVTRTVTVNTVASFAQRQRGEDPNAEPAFDVMIFDESYQSTFADAAAAAANAQSVLLVGDPGQIGPVVRSDTRILDQARLRPHRRAPEVFADVDGAVVLRMDATYRLGQHTTDVIAPLYGFGFSSRRPDRHLVGPKGRVLPEIRPKKVAPAAVPADLPLLRTVVDEVARLLATSVITPDERHDLTEDDVAVVVSHNDQETTLKALLAEADHDGVTVGTADSLQGGQWHAVIALDPMLGHPKAGSHQLSPGRLCVMASRHMSHLIWIHDDQWEESLLEAAEHDGNESRLGVAVRRGLCDV
ncbi:AAA family ATPase [Aeromicrobium sp. CTD01-1L150]|uniref:AAA family ATPase n=1 Tax=Aeromicrobium sp. CTD01-1L150 TaxID=3341830 RepID=UPI0035BF97A8